ncbi:unnamed protein product, partial [Effrenium voratum]
MDLWVEVRTGERRYYWNASKEDVLWDPPPGVRVVWAAEKHPETGKTYYWNKETSESVWTLPIWKPERGAQPVQPQPVQPVQPVPVPAPVAQPAPGTVGGFRPRQSWADVRDAPYELEEFAPSAGQRILGSLTGRGFGGFSGGMDTHARWKEDYDDGRWWVGCRRRFLHEVAAVRGVREASAAWEMLPDELDPQRLALLDLDSTASTASVFPAEFCIAGADPEGPRRSGTVCPGYLVAAFGDSPYEVADAMWTLSQAWWALVKATSRLVTLVFVTGLGGNSLEADAHEEASFLELYRRCLMQAPAPLIFAAQRKGGGRRPRLLGGWQILKAHRDQAEEWLHPGSWKWGGAERWGSAPSGPSGPSHPGRGGKGAGRWEDEAWDAWEAWEDDSEDALLESVTAFLGSGPKEVQELASLFAGRFNAVVRADPRNGFSQDKKNDGSFKKWLLTCGFEASALFDRNKCMISVPHAKRTTRGTRGQDGR